MTHAYSEGGFIASGWRYCILDGVSFEHQLAKALGCGFRTPCRMEAHRRISEKLTRWDATDTDADADKTRPQEHHPANLRAPGLPLQSKLCAFQVGPFLISSLCVFLANQEGTVLLGS
eukprot:scaffold305_cov247-Pinguiococcus_pyrenoidosus.AAC.17